jgi:predicted RNA-binding Zn-ribbon protein involved in translation (DUF1610 family)
VTKTPESVKSTTKTVEERSFMSKPSLSSSPDSIKSIDLEDKIELERKEAYIEPKTRDFLRILLQYSDNIEISPKISAGIGYIYQIVDHLCPDDVQTISVDFLLKLSRLDILKKSFFDSIASCPDCGSIFLTLHNRCPKCKSHNIDKSGLIEHIPCGLIEQKGRFVGDMCPKCGEALIEGKYRNMGRWYICQVCGDRFENPEYDLICHICNTNFTIKEAAIREIPKFSLNPQRKKEIRQNIASLEDIRAILKELGFTIEIPGLTIGLKSGMQHHFSLIAKKQIDQQEIVIALDHAASEAEVQASPLILYIYKTSEVKVDIPIFIAMPQLSETARKIAQGHNILLIEGAIEDPEDMANIRSQIEDRITQKVLSNLPEPTEDKKPEPSSSFLNKFGFKKKASN